MDKEDLDMGFDWAMVEILCNVSATLPDFPTNVWQQVNEPNVKTITFILSCSIFYELIMQLVLTIVRTLFLY